MQVLYYAEKVSSVSSELYNYCIRKGSISNQSHSKECMTQYINLVKNISTFFENKGYRKIINYLKFMTKMQIKSFYNN